MSTSSLTLRAISPVLAVLWLCFFNAALSAIYDSPCSILQLQQNVRETPTPPKKHCYLTKFKEDFYSAPKVKLTTDQLAYFYSLGSYNSYEPSDRTYDHVYPARDSAPRRKKRSIISSPMKTRKEYRQLTSTERNALHAAFNAMKGNFIGGLSEYDIFVALHRGVDAPAAHFGAAFLPWHREYLWRFERALQVHDPNVALPYWDSTLDQELPEPRDSYLWTANLLGNNNGPVTSGPFNGWYTGAVAGCDGYLERGASAAPYGNGHLFSDYEIQTVLDQNKFKDIVLNTGIPFENNHGGVHVFVGGHMASIPCSPSDPVFWMHHAFVDCTWELFRQNRQTTNRELEYPTTSDGYIGSPAHAHYAPMGPFPGVVNIHGLSNHYTNYYYKCAPRPNWCCIHNECGSPYLWCDLTDHKCKAMVKEGGDCTGLPHKACYGNYGCYNNKCQDLVISDVVGPPG